MKLWQMSDPSLNPFIEQPATGTAPGHSLASCVASSASPKPVVQPEDVVIRGTTSADDVYPKDFGAALNRVLGLTDAELDSLRAVDPSDASSPTGNVLTAVRRCVML